MRKKHLLLNLLNLLFAKTFYKTFFSKWWGTPKTCFGNLFSFYVTYENKENKAYLSTSQNVQ